MFNKNEILNAIEINNAAISEYKERAKKLERIISMIADYERDYETTLVNADSINNMLDGIYNEITWHKEQNKKRNKQLKLIAQMEALEDGE